MDQADKPKRKHRATGKSRGGAREGAGRPAEASNALGYGEVQAIKAANLRVPEAVPPALKQAANRAFERIIDVMEERVSSLFGNSRAVLSAATHIREEICGPVAQKHELTGKDGERLRVSININRGQK